ncbi:MAG: glycosyltransferase [Cyanobacteria bacterium M_surface_7_m2_040]|nr:glycosyltransferase [Cyanobacteria bacterium M_surface_7_m2_040]
MASLASPPRLSTVVVTRNNPNELQATLASIAHQTALLAPKGAAAVEVIVVDGSDAAVGPQQLRSWLGPRPALLVLRDHPACGIYAAMNQGLAASRGELVQFLNAGDAWFDQHALAAVLQALEQWASQHQRPARALFGQALICPQQSSWVAPWLVPDPSVSQVRRWLRIYVPNHQSMVVDGVWARANPFRLDAPHAADRTWMRAALHDWSQVLYLNRPLVRYQLGGVSSRLPDWALLRLRLREPSRTPVDKLAEVVKFGLRPLQPAYPALMALRSRLIGWLL